MSIKVQATIGFDVQNEESAFCIADALEAKAVELRNDIEAVRNLGLMYVDTSFAIEALSRMVYDVEKAAEKTRWAISSWAETDDE